MSLIYYVYKEPVLPSFCVAIKWTMGQLDYICLHHCHV